MQVTHRRYLLLAMLAAALCVLAGCGDDEDASGSDSGGGTAANAADESPLPELPPLPDYELPDAKPAKPYQMALLLPHRAEAVNQSADLAAQDEAKELGVSVTVQDAGGYENPETQVAQYENAVASGANAIIMLAVDQSALSKQIADAKDKGIVTIGLLTSPESPDVALKLNEDLSKEGELMLDALVRAMDGEGEAWFLTCCAGAPFIDLFRQGAEAAIEKHSGVEFSYVDSIVGHDPGKFVSAAESAYTAHPDVKGLFTSSIADGLAVLRGIRSAGGPSDVPIVANSIQGKDDLDALRSGEAFAVSVSPSPAAVRMAMRYAILALNGEDIPAEIDLEAAIMTSENVEDAVSSGKLYDYVHESLVK